jgi:hypothetical protein
MSRLNDHHWRYWQLRFRELRRIARRRVVLFSANPAEARPAQDPLPGRQLPAVTLERDHRLTPTEVNQVDEPLERTPPSRLIRVRPAAQVFGPAIDAESDGSSSRRTSPTHIPSPEPRRSSVFGRPRRIAALRPNGALLSNGVSKMGATDAG